MLGILGVWGVSIVSVTDKVLSSVGRAGGAQPMASDVVLIPTSNTTSRSGWGPIWDDSNDQNTTNLHTHPVRTPSKRGCSRITTECNEYDEQGQCGACSGSPFAAC